MKSIAFSCLIPALTAGLLLTTPTTASARDRHHNYSSRSSDCGRSGGRSVVISGSPYYSRGYSPYSYGYSSYPRSYVSAGFSSAYCAPTASIGFSLFSSPLRTYRPSTYYSSSYDQAGGASRSNDLAVDVQRALRRNGFYYGDIDGDIGPESRAAIREFQRDRGLPATGRIDSSLLRSLRIG